MARKDVRLADDRAKLLDVLNKLTDRNEQLLREQQNSKDTYEGELSTQRALVAALEIENGLLRERVEDKENEITELERKVAVLETSGSGTYFMSSCIQNTVEFLLPDFSACYSRANTIFLCMSRRGKSEKTKN